MSVLKFVIKNKPVSKNTGKALIILKDWNFNKNTALPHLPTEASGNVTNMLFLRRMNNMKIYQYGMVYSSKVFFQF